VAFKISCDKSSPVVINENQRGDWKKIFSYAFRTRKHDRVGNIQTNGDFPAGPGMTKSSVLETDSDGYLSAA